MQRAPLLTTAFFGLLATLLGCGGSNEPSAGAALVADGWQVHGRAFEDATASSVTEVLARSNGESVRVKGTVERVCQASGCWLDLTDGEQSVRIHFENEDGSRFYLPLDGRGGSVIAEGVLEETDGERSIVASGARFEPPAR